MMTLGRAVLELVTDPTKLHAGLDEAKTKTQGWSSGISALAGPATMAIAAIGAASVAGAAAVFEMGNKAADSAMDVRKLSRETGLGAEQASELRYAGERLNISTDDLSKSLGKFSKGLESTHPALAKYNVEVVKTKDGHIDMEKTLGNVADKFKSMPDGVEKTALAMDLFGKSGKDMIPLLNEGSAGLATQGEEAKKLGLVFSKDGVESAFKYKQAQKDLEDRFTGLTNNIGTAVLPALAGLFEMLAGLADKVLPVVASLFGTIFGVLQDVFGVITGSAPGAGGALVAAIGEGPAKAIMGALGSIRDAVKDLFDKIGTAIDFLKRNWDVFGPAFAVVALVVIVPAMIAWASAAISAAAATVLALAPVMIPLLLIGATVVLIAGMWKTNMGDIQGKTQAVVTAVQDFFDNMRLFILQVWRGIVLGVAAAINGVIGVIDGFIQAYNGVAEKLGLPLLGTISLVTPNVSEIDARISQIARDREARITVTTEYIDPGAGASRGRAFAGGTDYVPKTGLYGLHEGERVITAADNRAGRTGGGNAADHDHPIVINLDGRTIASVVGRHVMRGAELAGASIG